MSGTINPPNSPCLERKQTQVGNSLQMFNSTGRASNYSENIYGYVHGRKLLPGLIQEGSSYSECRISWLPKMLRIDDTFGPTHKQDTPQLLRLGNIVKEGEESM